MLKQIDHQIILTEYSDGSHEIDFSHFNKESFLSFAAYLMSSGFAEHWMDKLPTELVLLLSPGCPHDHPVNPDAPVMEPSEVFNSSNDEDRE